MRPGSCSAAAASTQSRQARRREARSQTSHPRLESSQWSAFPRALRRSHAQLRARAPIPGACCPTEHPPRKSVLARRGESRGPGQLPRAARTTFLAARVSPLPSRFRRTEARSTRGCRAPAAAEGGQREAEATRRRPPLAHFRLRVLPLPPPPRSDGRCRAALAVPRKPSHRQRDVRSRGTLRLRARRAGVARWSPPGCSDKFPR